MLPKSTVAVVLLLWKERLPVLIRWLAGVPVLVVDVAPFELV
jgi:hypothetical protein